MTIAGCFKHVPMHVFGRGWVCCMCYEPCSPPTVSFPPAVGLPEVPADLQAAGQRLWEEALADGTPAAGEMIARALLIERERCAALAERRKDRYTTSVGVELHCQEISPDRTLQDHINAFEEARSACIAEGGSEVSSAANQSPTIRGIAAVVKSVVEGYVSAIRNVDSTNTS